MPTNWTDSGLLPEAVADRVLTAVEQESAVLALATRRPMPAGIEYLPLAANAPKATWIDTGGRKPYQPSNGAPRNSSLAKSRSPRSLKTHM